MNRRFAVRGIDVHVRIQNTGPVAGDEVALVYLNKPDQPPAGVQFAESALAGFARVHPESGRSTQIAIRIPPRQLQYWSAPDSRWIGVTGARTRWVGGSSRDRKIEARFTGAQ